MMKKPVSGFVLPALFPAVAFKSVRYQTSSTKTLSLGSTFFAPALVPDFGAEPAGHCRPRENTAGFVLAGGFNQEKIDAAIDALPGAPVRQPVGWVQDCSEDGSPWALGEFLVHQEGSKLSFWKYPAVVTEEHHAQIDELICALRIKRVSLRGLFENLSHLFGRHACVTQIGFSLPYTQRAMQEIGLYLPEVKGFEDCYDQFCLEGMAPLMRVARRDPNNTDRNLFSREFWSQLNNFGICFSELPSKTPFWVAKTYNYLGFGNPREAAPSVDDLREAWLKLSPEQQAPYVEAARGCVNVAPEIRPLFDVILG